MANFTPNYNLKKPLGSENYNVADQNGNMDIIDTALNGIENGLAIVSTGNTHGAITSGQYVYVRRHSTLSEGLYKANSNIAANATLTSSNLSSVSGGLGADVASLNSNFNDRYVTFGNHKFDFVSAGSWAYYTIPNLATIYSSYIVLVSIASQLNNDARPTAVADQIMIYNPNSSGIWENVYVNYIVVGVKR